LTHSNILNLGDKWLFMCGNGRSFDFFLIFWEQSSIGNQILETQLKSTVVVVHIFCFLVCFFLSLSPFPQNMPRSCTTKRFNFEQKSEAKTRLLNVRMPLVFSKHNLLKCNIKKTRWTLIMTDYEALIVCIAHTYILLNAQMLNIAD
jgi:hypothetical protein